MIPGSPVGPPACEGYQAVATDGSYLHVARVHCPGCAESASLRERLATAEAERDELRGRLKATEEKRDWWHRLHGDATLALQAARAELDGNLAKRDAYLARLTEDGSFKEKP